MAKKKPWLTPARAAALQRAREARSKKRTTDIPLHVLPDTRPGQRKRSPQQSGLSLRERHEVVRLMLTYLLKGGA